MESLQDMIEELKLGLNIGSGGRYSLTLIMSPLLIEHLDIVT
jgi:hypothetical protein